MHKDAEARIIVSEQDFRVRYFVFTPWVFNEQDEFALRKTFLPTFIIVGACILAMELFSM